MKVSVIIPFRNKNELLMICIESIKRQNYKDVEIIVVSDSTLLNERGVKSFCNPKLKGPGLKRNYRSFMTFRNRSK